jgi:phospholipid-binding lipoprotein MlaA
MLRCFAKIATPFFILSTFANVTWASDNQDPWEHMNRKIYSFNKTLDNCCFKPVAKGYRAVTPQVVDDGITRFFSNLKEPLVALNNGLQGKGRQSASDVGRFVVNTVTSAGFVDVAQKIGLEKHEEDFGQTFGKWGASSGSYLMLPFLGSSSVRDLCGKPFDMAVNPRNLVKNNAANIGLLTLELVDLRADVIPLEKIIEGDEYVLLRDVYLQRRDFLVHDGQVKDTFMDDDVDENEGSDRSVTTP